MSALGLELQGLYDCARSPYLVYVVEAPHAVKVGISAHDIASRVAELERASGHAGLRVADTWGFPDRKAAYGIEQGVFWVLRDHRTVGEWFDCTPDEACAAVAQVIETGRPFESAFTVADATALRERFPNGGLR